MPLRTAELKSTTTPQKALPQESTSTHIYNRLIKQLRILRFKGQNTYYVMVLLYIPHPVLTLVLYFQKSNHVPDFNGID